MIYLNTAALIGRSSSYVRTAELTRGMVDPFVASALMAIDVGYNGETAACNIKTALGVHHSKIEVNM